VEHKVAINTSNRTYWTTDDIKRKIQQSQVVVFAKGDEENPLCGFSKQAFQAVKDCGRPYEVINVCRDKSISAALKTVSGRQLLPLIYVNGQLVNSPEIVKQDLNTSELKSKVQQALNKTH
jgi:monothiol glutaredoxin